MNEELPRSKGDALLDRLMQLRMLYEKEHEVYDAAMDWYAACRDQEDYDVDQADEELDKLWEVCRRAKEGR